jgi:transposase
MLSKEDYLMIQAQVDRGVYQKDIAAELGVHPRTIRRALEPGGAPRPRRVRGSKLNPYKSLVDNLLQESVWNAVVILREIQAKGYRGQITVLRDYIRPKRVLRRGLATVRFETPPGRQMQSDWGEIWTFVAGKRTKVHFSDPSSLGGAFWRFGLGLQVDGGARGSRGLTHGATSALR